MNTKDTRVGVYRGNTTGWYLFVNKGTVCFFFLSNGGICKSNATIQGYTKRKLELPEEYFL